MPRRPPTTPRQLLLALREALALRGDAERARGARAYMKCAMPFHGTGAGPFREACREVFPRYPMPDAAAWRAAVLGLWRGARYREERYGAIELAGDRRARPFQDLAALPMYEEMIVTGAWWDLVDGLASHRLGDLLRRFPGPMRDEMLAWSRCADLWKRRAAILCQLRFKGETDLDLLYAVVEPSIGSTEFFLRKAIGWALRQHAWTDPDEVARYVAENEGRLSGLSKREALKNAGRRRGGYPPSP